MKIIHKNLHFNYERQAIQQGEWCFCWAKEARIAQTSFAWKVLCGRLLGKGKVLVEGEVRTIFTKEVILATFERFISWMLVMMVLLKRKEKRVEIGTKRTVYRKRLCSYLNEMST